MRIRINEKILDNDPVVSTQISDEDLHILIQNTKDEIEETVDDLVEKYNISKRSNRSSLSFDEFIRGLKEYLRSNVTQTIYETFKGYIWKKD